MVRFPPRHARGLADTAYDHMNDRRKVDVLRQLEPRAAFRDVPDEAGDRRADATDLADMLRLGRLPEAWIARRRCASCAGLVRYRAKLVQLRSGLKAQVHAVMAKESVLPRVVDMFGPAGQVQLNEMASAATTRSGSNRW